jgi:dTDP-4-dehydrorhamnose reductase
MLGSAVFRGLSASESLSVFGTVRSVRGLESFGKSMKDRLISGIDVLDSDSLIELFRNVAPDVVVNCVGLVKQLSSAKDPLSTLPVNAMLPHRLSKICALSNARLIHISTDCVFSGRKGMYLESDISDAEDLYGKSKFIGEVIDQQHAITLRTSIIGHELNSQSSLVDWFLSQTGPVKGYSRAIFSGVPTVELTRIILDYVIPNPALHGLYHVSAEPIDKCSLLKLVSSVYQKTVDIQPNDELVIDRSLNSDRFRSATGYTPPSWPALIEKMHSQY